jgi:hypothetical protein
MPAFELLKLTAGFASFEGDLFFITNMASDHLGVPKEAATTNTSNNNNNKITIQDHDTIRI